MLVYITCMQELRMIFYYGKYTIGPFSSLVTRMITNNVLTTILAISTFAKQPQSVRNKAICGRANKTMDLFLSLF